MGNSVSLKDPHSFATSWQILPVVQVISVVAVKQNSVRAVVIRQKVRSGTETNMGDKVPCYWIGVSLRTGGGKQRGRKWNGRDSTYSGQTRRSSKMTQKINLLLAIPAYDSRDPSTFSKNSLTIRQECHSTRQYHK